jgi:hypothetical protein
MTVAAHELAVPFRQPLGTGGSRLSVVAGLVIAGTAAVYLVLLSMPSGCTTVLASRPVRHSPRISLAWVHSS